MEVERLRSDEEVDKAFLGQIFTKYRTITGEYGSEDTLRFFKEDGSYLEMTHDQDCCECVELIDIAGDLKDLVGSPILQFEVVEREPEEGEETPWPDEDMQWTFYKIATIKGSVTLRWFGSSNGYYSVGVDIFHVKQKDNHDN